MYLTRNQAYRKVPWVRIPPSPPTCARFFHYQSSSRPFLLLCRCSHCVAAITDFVPCSHPASDERKPAHSRGGLDMNLKKFPLCLWACVALAGCNQQWAAFVYPEKSDLAKIDFIGEFQTLGACRAAAHRFINRLSAYGHAINSDYECGLNCENSSPRPQMCERIEK
jgi:hypothetical protein